MRARDDLIRMLAFGALNAEVAERALAAYDVEVLRMAAQRIRFFEALRYPGTIYGAIRRTRAAYYADLIDPDKDNT